MKVSMNKKYITKNGDKVRLLCVDRDTPYSVVALIGTDSFIETFTDKGRRNALGSHPRDLVEIPELEDFQIDDPVMVRVKGGCWMKRYFAKVGDDGAPMTWLGGATSWSSDGLISWDECRLPTKEELGGWTHKRKHDVETTK